MHYRVVTAVIFLVLTASCLANAQEKAQPPAAADAPAAPAAKAGPAKAEFERVFSQWKTVLADLTQLKIEYRTAKGQRSDEIQKQWKELMSKATGLQEQLIDAAEKAYAEAPNSDKAVTDLLLGLLHDYQNRDDCEKAFALGKLLVENKCEDPQATGMAGMAAFCVGEFDLAEAWLEQTKKTGSLPLPAEMRLAGLPYYKQAWPKEKQLREAEAKADDLPRVLLKTSKGDIELELFENEAPNSVANFISLVEKGFYKGLTFHRVLEGFMAQGGCPKGDGSGGPGYHIPAEFTKENHRLHFRGSLAMARSQDADSAGSQFYLMFAPNRELDGNYTVFGRVIKGFEVLAKIQRRNPEEPDQPRPDKILDAKVLRKRDHDYVPKHAE